MRMILNMYWSKFKNLTIHENKYKNTKTYMCCVWLSLWDYKKKKTHTQDRADWFN